jgi:nucleoside-diphosphate-sugar epimerase
LKVLVTGGRGRLGRYVVSELSGNGYEVVVADKVRSGARGEGGSIDIDITDIARVRDVLRGIDSVVHLAAIPTPDMAPPETVFTNNVLGAFNVAQAATEMGVRRLVYASSTSALGFAFAKNHFSPSYFPIDEEHPLLPQDPYGLSKVVGEEILGTYSRRTGGSAVSLRFPLILSEDVRGVLPSLRSGPSKGAVHLWSYIDPRDAALVCRLALERRASGHEAMFVAADDTFMDEPTVELIQSVFPETVRIGDGMSGRASPISSARAKRALGFKARFGWEVER